MNKIKSWCAAVKFEFIEHLPIWLIYFGSILTLFLALSIFPDELFAPLGLHRGYFTLSTFFQLFIFLVYMGMRIKRSGRSHNKFVSGFLLVVLSFGLPAVILIGHKPFPMEPGFLKRLIEIQSYILVAVFAVQILCKRDSWNLLTFFGVTLIYGLMLENTGIIMGYYFEPGYLVYLGPLPAPLSNMAGWSMVFYVMFSITERLTEWWPWLHARAWARAVLTTFLALCLDVQIDPLASLSGFLWRWDPSLDTAFLGVPILNFAAWTGAVLPFSWILYRIFDRTDMTPGRKSWELFLRLPLASVLGGIICFGIMAIVEGGFNGPTYQILDRFLERLIPY